MVVGRDGGLGLAAGFTIFRTGRMLRWGFRKMAWAFFRVS